MDEYHDIWDPADIPYKLSVSYLARVIGLDSGEQDDFPDRDVGLLHRTA